MRTLPLFIEETNLSVAWAGAFLRSLERGVRGLAPLVVHVTGFENGDPREREPILECLDEALTRLGHYNCHTVANTIFPANLWKRCRPDRQRLYARYLRLFRERIKRHMGNHFGLYFERLIAFGRGPEGGNQIEHLIKNYEAGVSRPTAMVLNVFDHERDAPLGQRVRGFPCMKGIELTPLGGGKVAIKADYPAQYLFERGYGNYLGLCRLGKFIAWGLGLELTQFTCTVGIASTGDVPKRELAALADALRVMVEGHRATVLNGESHVNVG